MLSHDMGTKGEGFPNSYSKYEDIFILKIFFVESQFFFDEQF